MLSKRRRLRGLELCDQVGMLCQVQNACNYHQLPVCVAENPPNLGVDNFDSYPVLLLWIEHGGLVARVKCNCCYPSWWYTDGAPAVSIFYEQPHMLKAMLQKLQPLTQALHDWRLDSVVLFLTGITLTTIRYLKTLKQSVSLVALIPPDEERAKPSTHRIPLV